MCKQRGEILLSNTANTVGRQAPWGQLDVHLDVSATRRRRKGTGNNGSCGIDRRTPLFPPNVWRRIPPERWINKDGIFIGSVIGIGMGRILLSSFLLGTSFLPHGRRNRKVAATSVFSGHSYCVALLQLTPRLVLSWYFALSGLALVAALSGLPAISQDTRVTATAGWRVKDRLISTATAATTWPIYFALSVGERGAGLRGLLQRYP